METGTDFVAHPIRTPEEQRCGNDDEDVLSDSSNLHPLIAAQETRLFTWFLCRVSLAGPISRFQLVKNELHSFPLSVPGPRAQLDPGGLKDWHGEGEAFFESLFGHRICHFESKICFMETNSLIKTTFKLQHYFTVKYFEQNFIAQNSHGQKFINKMFQLC